MSRYPLVRRDLVLAAVAAVLVAVSGLVFMVGTSYEWDGVWTQTGQYLRGGLLLAGPIVAAYGAWMGAVERRNGFTELASSSPRAIVRRHAAPVLTTLVSVIVGYGIVVAYASIRTASKASFGHFSIGFTGIAFASICGLALVGYAIGLRFPWRLLPLVMVVGAYAIMSLLNSSATVGNLQPVDTRDVTLAKLPTTLALSWVGWFLALGLFAVLLVWRWRASAVLAAAVAVFCAVSLVAGPGFPFSHDALAAQRQCSTVSDVTVCMTRVHNYLSGQLRPLVVSSRKPLLGTPLAPTRYQESASGDSGRRGNTVVFATTNGRLVSSASINDDAQLGELATETFSALSCSTANQSPGPTPYQVTATDVVEAWYRNQLGLPTYTVVDPEDKPQVRKFQKRTTQFSTLPAATRTSWIRTHAHELLSCELPVTALP